MMLTVYYTSDTHGYLYPTNFCDNKPRAMGLFCMSFPKDGNTLVIDGGDTTQGSPLTYYCYATGAPSPAPAALNRLGCDYVTLGNHDFNHGYGGIRDYLRALDAKCLCANLQDERGELPLLACDVRTLQNGVRVGLVGVVTDWVNRWEKPENLAGLRVGDPLKAAKKAVASLQADVLIGVYHGGFERDVQTGAPTSDTNENIGWRLCEELPFDILLTGHQHVPIASGEVCGTHVVQTPCNATAYIKLTMDDDRRITSELCPVPDHLEPTREQTRFLSGLDAWLDRPIGRLSHAIWPEDKLAMALGGSPIADFFNTVQLEASGAELSCTALPNELRGFAADVTVRDVVSSYVYANTMAVLEVTGQVLRQALEQCATYFAVSGRTVSIDKSFLLPNETHFNYDYFSGVEYTFDLNRPVGRRVASLTRHGRPVADADIFTLCMNDYRATGAGGFACYRGCKVVQEIQTEVSEAILDYFSEHKTVEVQQSSSLHTILPE